MRAPTLEQLHALLAVLGHLHLRSPTCSMQLAQQQLVFPLILDDQDPVVGLAGRQARHFRPTATSARHHLGFVRYFHRQFDPEQRALAQACFRR